MSLPDDAMVAPIVIDIPEALAESAEESPAEDSALWARAVEAAGDAGDGRRADALICARALLADRQGDAAAALALWNSAFDRDPTLLVAFWGLRRALIGQGAWQDLLGVLERRISAEQAEARADLWMEHGRISEDRLSRDDDAARSYRAGLIEISDHPALLTSLLLVGFRRADRAMIAEALAGLLRRSLPSTLRASTTAFLARLERTSGVGVAGGDSPAGKAAVAAPIDPVVAARVLEMLRHALRAVGPGDLAPLLGELSTLARVTSDPATRVEILHELVSYGPGDAAVPLLRERARLLRDNLDNAAGAAEALRGALGRAPHHPLVIAELGDLVETGAPGSGEQGANAVSAVDGLAELLAVVAPHDRAFETDAERELALRYLTALVRAGRSQDGLAILDRHAELPRDRPDVFLLEILMRVAVGDVPGLAVAFERNGERLAAGAVGDSPAAEEAAHALVVAGTLRERSRMAAAAADTGVGHTPSDSGNQETDPTRLYRRAVEIAPSYVPALDAVERRLWAAGRWPDLTDALLQRLARLMATNGAPVERLRLLEDLVAVHRDHLDDPVSARRYQDELLDLGDADARAWVRRNDLELALVARGEASSTETRVRIVRALADRAGSARLEAALRVEAARLAAAGGDAVAAEVLLRQALSADTAGAATAGLERLAAGADAAAAAKAAIRADLVRAEIAGIVKRGDAGTGAYAVGAVADAGRVRGASGVRDASDASDASDVPKAVNQDAAGNKAACLRALRFRVAWHALGAKRPGEALEALSPLRAAGDQAAQGWSWEIARRSGDPQLEVATLREMPEGLAAGLIEVPGDLGEALERSGDLVGAEAAFREAQLKQPSTDVALGLLRVAAVQGNAPLVLEAVRELAALADPVTALLLTQEAALLALFQSTAPGVVRPTAAAPASDLVPANAQAEGSEGRSLGVGGALGTEAPAGVVLRWATGARGGDVLGAAAGLLGFARALPDTDAIESSADRNGLLARAAARARLGGAALGGAVHDQVVTLSGGAAPIGVGLADLPVMGHADRVAARVARAERTGGPLGYALDVERALDAEARGDAEAALDGFARALGRDAAGIEALDGIKRLALATGDRVGAARAGMRLAAVLRAPARAAAGFAVAGQTWEDLGMMSEAIVAYWQALSRDPPSTWLYERLRHLLGARSDWATLDHLYGLRLVALGDPRARTDLLLERAAHRLDKMANRKAAIEDFKRILKIDPQHAAALRYLATLATQMEYFPQAVRFLDRLLALRGDEVQVANLRLELAEAHEAARDPARAVEVLREAASARPRDTAPWQRLTDLLLRTGDWSAALGTLRSWDTVLGDPVAKAKIWIRIGELLRDQGRDAVAAAAAFVTASELDPLGDGIRRLVALHERRGAIAARQGAISRAIVDLRQALAADPLDVPRLLRLKELHEMLAARGDLAAAGDAGAADDQAWGAAGARVVGQILTLAGEDVELPPPRWGEPRATLSLEFWSQLRLPGASGFAAEIWPTLAEAGAELFPVQGRFPPRERVPQRSEPRLAWVEVAAAAVGLPTLALFLPKAGGASGKGILVLDDNDVIPIEGSPPGLLLGRGVLAGDAGARFRVGRALGLLRDRAVVFERITAIELGTLLAAAAVVAGASAPVDAGGLKNIEDRARVLGKAMGRKDRRALELEASRFGFEAIDATDFRESALATADRLGLVLAGDAAVAARIAGGIGVDADPSATLTAIGRNERVLGLIRFALSHDYLMLRRGSGAEEG